MIIEAYEHGGALRPPVLVADTKVEAECGGIFEK